MISSGISSFSRVHFMPVLSSSCNAKCNYCFGPNRGEKINDRILSQFIEFIRIIADETKQERIPVTFHGGEPLLAGHSIWEKTLSTFSREFEHRKVEFGVQSNLWKLDQQYVDLFKKYHVSVGTSLDGPEEINDLQRGKGYYNKTIAGINLLKANNIQAGCIATFTPFTTDHYKKIFDFFRNNNIKFSIHSAVRQLGKPANEFTLVPGTFGELLCNMLDLYIPKRHLTKLSTLDHFCISFLEQTGNVCTFKDCLGMFLAIDPSGDVFNCQRFCGRKEYAFGNIRSIKSINDLLSSPAAQRIIEYQERIKEECGGCEHFAYCRGGCLYNALASDNIKDPYCEAYQRVFNKIKNHLLNEMQSEENIKAIISKPFANKHTLFQKGPVTELCYKNSHPYDISCNAIRIISAVEIAKHSSLSGASESLNTIGISANESSLENLLKSIIFPKWSVNNIYIHLTYNCQLSCNHCYSVSTENNNEYLSCTSLEPILMAAKKIGFRQVIFTGGEPLLHPEFKGILTVLSEVKRKIYPMHLVLRTNFIKDLSAVDLNEIAYAFTKIIVSLDGDELTHEMRRGKGTYMKTLKNIENYQKNYSLRKETAELSLACVLSKKDNQNAAAVSSIENVKRNLNIDKIRYKPLLPLGRAFNWNVQPVNDEIESLCDFDEVLEKTFIPSNSCGIGHNIYIEPNGDAYPCYGFKGKHSYLGNVIYKGLENIITSGKFQDISRHTVDTNIKCSKCHLRYICGGACRAWDTKMENHDPDSAPQNCSGLYKRAEKTYTLALNYLNEHHRMGSDQTK